MFLDSLRAKRQIMHRADWPYGMLSFYNLTLQYLSNFRLRRRKVQ